jgi:hypothetical protein
MNRNWRPATLRWLAPDEGGRKRLPEGAEYAPTARFVGDNPGDAFSVVIRRPNPQMGWNVSTNSIEISLLFPENLPAVEQRLLREPIVILEGPRPVAECHVLQSAPT